jgi:plasmid rolling circle replication initiator protein Rep
VNNNITLKPETVKFLNSVDKKLAKEKTEKNKNGAEILAYTYPKTDLLDRERKAARLHLCGKVLAAAQSPSGDVAFGAVRCKIRLCPSCSFIRARQVFENVYSVITEPDFSGKHFVFLTLTVRNCCGGSLDGEIKRLLKAWKNLVKDNRKPFRKSFLGTFRALEVTYNRFTKEFHPHIHAIAVVDPEYFKKSNPEYISHARLRELWRDSCGLDYLPQCRIQRVSNSTKKQVAEVAKYTVKSADYIGRPEAVEALDPALHGKRLVAYGGLFRDVRKRLGLPDEDDVPETSVPRFTFEELMADPLISKAFYEWQLGAYRLVKIYERPSAVEIVSAAQQMSGEIIDNYLGVGGQGGA